MWHGAVCTLYRLTIRLTNDRIYSHLVFTKPELVLDDGTVTIDLPDEVVRRAGRAARFLLEYR